MALLLPDCRFLVSQQFLQQRNLSLFSRDASSVTLAAPAVPTDTAQTVTVANPDDSFQSATFFKQNVPADIQNQLPSVGHTVALTLMIGGVATPVLVSSVGTMVFPLGAVPA